jgi:phage terminase large subunit
VSGINITMPHEWSPRAYQLPALQALDTGCKRAILLWHRRAGTDSAALNWAAKEMAREPTSCLYLFPEFGQAKRTVFRELNDDGRTYLDQAFPLPIRDGKPNTQEAFMKLWNGSIFQLGGFDNIDRYMGSNPKIVVMSEFATSKHADRAWKLLYPILVKNGGTAIFPYTPRGNNHAKELYDKAKGNPGWFVSKLDCEQTGIMVDRDGHRISLVDAVRRDIDMGEIDENHARQEFWCSWEAPNTGSYYGRLLEAAENQGRVTHVPWNPALPVYTWWDIGVFDATVIWFVQRERGGALRLIDYYEADGEGLAHYIQVLNERRDMGWTFEPRGQLVPHDFGDRDFQSGETPEKAARALGWRMTVVPRPTNIQHGIDAVRRVLPLCWFDKERCGVGYERLKAYTKRWSPQLERFMGPEHDANSHAADAFRTGVAGMVLAGMHLAPNVSQAKQMGAMAMSRGSAPVVAVTDFNVWR